MKVAQLCLTLCDPMDCIIHGILQARILEWVAFPFSRGSAQPRDRTQVLHIAGGFFTSWATREAHVTAYAMIKPLDSWQIYMFRHNINEIVRWILQYLWGDRYLSLFKCKYQFNCVLFHSVFLIVFLFYCFPVFMSLLIVSYIVRGERNGNPLQYSCLDIPVNRGAWWAAGHRVAQSRTQLKRLSMHACIGEGNGNPLQYSCLENPRDRGAWWAAIYGAAQSRTWLKQLSSSSNKGSLADY